MAKRSNLLQTFLLLYFFFVLKHIDEFDCRNETDVRVQTGNEQQFVVFHTTWQVRKQKKQNWGGVGARERECTVGVVGAKVWMCV